MSEVIASATITSESTAMPLPPGYVTKPHVGNPNIRDPSIPHVILSHANCPDGAASATAMDTFLRSSYGTANVKTFFLNYGDVSHVRTDFEYEEGNPTPKSARHFLVDRKANRDIEVTGAYVYITDFSLPPDAIVEMASRCKEILVLDHHKTAIEKFTGFSAAGNVTLIFDTKRSGVGITWDWTEEQRKILGQEQIGKMPALYAYVQDRDLWKFELPNSKQVNAYVGLAEFTVEAYKLLLAEFSSNLRRVIDAGTAVYDYQLMLANAHVRKSSAMVASSVDGAVPYAYANATAVVSETGNVLLDAWPEVQFSATYFDDYPAKARIYSLRSRAGGYDVSALAKKFGGGGHHNAAGFKTKLNEEADFNSAFRSLATAPTL